MPDIAILNGIPSSLEEARVSVNDRGFLFGDGAYEVIRTYDGAPFLAEGHLDRLDRSLRELRITPDWDRGTLSGWIDQALAAAGYANAKVYIQVTRGTAPRNHPFPDVPPTTLVAVSEIHNLPEQLVREGVAVISTPDIRWGRCDIKSLNLLPNVLAKQAAWEAGAFEALLVAENGELREGAASNLFVVMDGTVVTPALGPHILAGVSRAYVIGLARDAGLPVAERPLLLDELFRADEVFLSGTTIELVGVAAVDGKTVGGGRPGPVTRRLFEAFRPKGT